jgi:DNA-binding transcriptional ArsR family regulator
MERQDVFEINDVETLEVLNDPMRMRLMHLLGGESKSVRELAEELDLPVTRLYYHINMLDEVGVIAVAETRKVGAMLQRRYQTVAHSYQPGSSLVMAVNNDRKAAEIAVATVIDGARLDAQSLVERRFQSGGREAQHPTGVLSRVFLELTPEEIRVCQERLSVLIEEMSATALPGRPDTEIYSLTMVLAPSVGPMKGQHT